MKSRAPHTRPRPSSLRGPATVFALFLFAGPAANLGAAETPLAPPSSKENPVEMLPFLVATDKDNGYAAADTISSGRLSTNLLMTPSSTTVLTRDFLNDLGAATMVEASSWLTSGIEQPQGAVNGSSMNVDPSDRSFLRVLRLFGT